MSDQAMKLFEALSGVDEELLDRCNQKENRKNGALRYIVWKCGKTIAACFCLIVVGAAAWTGYRLVTAPSGANDSAPMENGAPAVPDNRGHSADGAGRTGVTGYGEEGTGSEAAIVPPGSEPSIKTGVESASMADTAMVTSNDNADQPDIEDMQSQAIVKDGQEQADVLISASGKTESSQENSVGRYSDTDQKLADLLEKEYAISDSRQLILWEEACRIKPFNGYLPALLPEGYVPLSARQSSSPDVWDNMIFKWSDGEHILYLDMTLGDPMTKTDLEKSDGLHEYLAEEFGRELVPEPMDGQILFTLYYADGMRIMYGGYLTADEMWEIVESVFDSVSK